MAYRALGRKLLSGAGCAALALGASVLPSPQSPLAPAAAWAQQGQGKMAGESGGQPGLQGQGAGGQRGGQGMRGKSLLDVFSDDGEDDSDRPSWAGVPWRDGKPGRGNPDSGSKRGELFGDMYVLWRDDNGVPILVTWSDTDGDGVPDSYVEDPNGFVQPVDAEGNPIPLDEEGAIASGFEEDAQEVELGRLNVGRAPTYVLASRYDEVVANLNDPSVVSLDTDTAGRLMMVYEDGTTKTIDAPLENLAIYLELMSAGTLGGIASTSLFSGELANLVDGALTAEDLEDAYTFFAGASDKFGSIGVDTIVYMNQVLDLASYEGDDYVDYGSIAYDRETVWGERTVTLLLPGDDPETWVETEVEIFDDVFGGVSASADDLAGFTLAADDTLQVIEYIHEYAVPAEPTAAGSAALGN